MSVQNTIQLNDRMTPVLRSIMKALNQTLRAMAEVDRVGNESFRRAMTAARQASIAVGQLGNATVRTTQSQRRHTQSVGEGEAALNRMLGTVRNLITAYGVMQGISKLVHAGDAYIGSTAQLDLMLKMNDSQKTSAQLQDEIYAASQRSLGNYREMSKSVGKLGLLAGKAFGNNTDEMVAFTELLNKQFAITGATAWEKSAAMYQLTQAMASGRLQGDEFRSIIENAPMLAQTIQEYMGLTGEAFKEASKNGEITADVIKNSLFSVAKETNEMFENMPMRFGDLWTQVINKIDKGLEPVYKQLGKLWNNTQFQDFLTSLTNVTIALISSIVSVMSVIANVGSILYNNWSFVEPVLWGVGAVIAYFVIPALWALLPPLWAAVTAWLAANYPILLIGAAIAVLIGLMHAFGITTGQIIGWVVGVIMVAVAAIWNIIVAVIGFILAKIDFFANMVVGVVEFIYNAFNGGFDGIRGLADNLVGQLLATFFDLAKRLTPIIDAIFGTHWTDKISELQTHLRDAGKNEKAVTLKRDIFANKAKDLGINRMEYSSSWKAGNEWGNGVAGKVSDMFKVGDKKTGSDQFNPKLQNYDELLKNAQGTNKNTKDTANSLKEGVSLSDEDVQLLKDYARVQFTTRLTSLTPKVNATFGDVRETADVGGIMKLLEKFVKDASESDLTN